KRLVRFFLERASRVLALSEQWSRELARIAPRARVRTLPNAVYVRETPRVRDSSVPLRVLFAGRIGARKGTFDLLAAFARIASRFDATLVCAGDGECDALMARAAELGISDRVTCPGWLRGPAMNAEFGRACTFVLPSHAEGLPMALLEAMSHGLPVIATPVGGIPEVIEHGRNGLLVPPGDIDALERALTSVLEAPAERSRLGSAARETIEARFSLRTAIEQLAAIYREFGLEDPCARTSESR